MEKNIIHIAKERKNYSSYYRTIQPKTAIKMNDSLIIAYFTLNWAYLLQLVNKNKV